MLSLIGYLVCIDRGRTKFAAQGAAPEAARTADVQIERA